jgi:hypothetical protein
VTAHACRRTAEWLPDSAEATSRQHSGQARTHLLLLLGGAFGAGRLAGSWGHNCCTRPRRRPAANFQDVRTAATLAIGTTNPLNPGESGRRLEAAGALGGIMMRRVLGSTPGGVDARHRHEGGVHTPQACRGGRERRCRAAVHAPQAAMQHTLRLYGPAGKRRSACCAADQHSVSWRAASRCEGRGRGQCALRKAVVSGCSGREGGHRRHWSTKLGETAPRRTPAHTSSPNVLHACGRVAFGYQDSVTAQHARRAPCWSSLACELLSLCRPRLRYYECTQQTDCALVEPHAVRRLGHLDCCLSTLVLFETSSR